ncbi:MAG TPA: translation initiation factor eIF-1A [Candidatus Bathyarchaeia archaeon]|nr:translation initiation factor eIF-1A [Candidatus Bathyarchaeia archaeon]
MKNLSKKTSKPQKGQKKSRPYEREGTDVATGSATETGEAEYIRVRLPRQGEILGIVTQILGADRIKVRCMDKKDRVVRIPGKHRKRLWCRQNDIVSVMPWYGLQEDTRGDLVYRYNKNQAGWLEEKGYIVLD